MSAWQPIETAPEDGREVVLYHPPITRRAHWVKPAGAMSFPADIRVGPSTGISEHRRPTHWMPLPEAPK